MSKLFWTLVWGPVLRMDTGDDVIFLRPLVSALSQDVKLWRVREQSREGGRTGALKHDLLDLPVLELMARSSLISRVIVFGHKLVKNQDAWTTSRRTPRVMKSLASPRPRRLSPPCPLRRSQSVFPKWLHVNHAGLVGGVV